MVSNAFAKAAPPLIAICADKSFVTNQIAETLKNISYHQIDIGIAGEHLVLRAEELGLGTCWLGWFNEKAAKKILKIPSKIKILSLLAVGYYDENEQKPRAPKKNLEEILFWNKYEEK